MDKKLSDSSDTTQPFTPKSTSEVLLDAEHVVNVHKSRHDDPVEGSAVMAMGFSKHLAGFLDTEKTESSSD